MNILVLQGPNLNLLGLISSKSRSRITLDKVNTGLRRHNRNSDSELKIFQTHKAFQALNFLQRNRNWAEGILFAPMSWANYEYALRDTLSLIDLPAIQLLFPKEFESYVSPQASIYTDVCNDTIVEKPDSVFIKGYDLLHALG